VCGGERKRMRERLEIEEELYHPHTNTLQFPIGTPLY